MAQVFPAADRLRQLQPPLTTGELQVLDALHQLDDHWRVYVQPRLGLDIADFVIAHPEHGVVVLEIRDWRPGSFRVGPTGAIELRVRGGWEAVQDAPRFIAQRMATHLLNHCFADPNDQHRDPAVRAVVLLVRQATAEAVDLLGRTQLSVAEDRVQCIGGSELRADPASALRSQHRSRRMVVSARNLERLHVQLADVVPAQRLPADAGTRVIFDHPPGIRAIRARGSAGTGKTTALAARAARDAAAGKEVLLLAAAPALVTQFQRLVFEQCALVDADPRRVTSTHLTELCGRALDDARMIGQRIARPVRRIAEGAAGLLVDRAAAAYRAGFGPRFDTILVDDGQLLDPTWWDFLRDHVGHADAEMVLTVDPSSSDQSLWSHAGTDRDDRFAAPWLELDVQHRMSNDLALIASIFCARYMEAAATGLASARFGDNARNSELRAPTARRWRNVPAGGALGRSIGEEVVQLLLDHDDLSASEVVYLAPTSRSGLEAANTIDAAGFEVQHVFATGLSDAKRRRSRFDPDAPGVKGITPDGFLGMESRAVVLGVPPTSDAFRLALLGMTRVRAEPEGRSAMVTVVNQHVALRGFAFTFLSVGGRPSASAA